MLKYKASIFNRDCDAPILQDNIDEMQSTCLCPYCHQKTKVGNLVMISGFVGHSDDNGSGGCYWYPQYGLRDTVLRIKKTDYDNYVSGDFYREGFAFPND